MLYAAKCYWPGVTPTELVEVSARAENASAAAEVVTYLGSLVFADDDVVLCVFEGPSRAAVRRASEQAGIPCERLMASAWVDPRHVHRSKPKGDVATTPSPQQVGDTRCTGTP